MRGVPFLAKAQEKGISDRPLRVGTVQTQSASLEMATRPNRVILGEPVTFTITKTNLLPSDLEWSVRDILSESVEFVSAALSRGLVPYWKVLTSYHVIWGPSRTGSRRPWT